jgi:hypothetical protein
VNAVGESPRASVLRSGEVPPSADGTKGQAPFDPLRLCIFTTIALLAWLLTPPLVVVWMATLGLLGYVKAYREGLTRSKCFLRDVRLVLLYLSLAWIAGAYFTVYSVIHWMS